MHHIYTTPTFVIHSSPHGEAGKFFLLFTRDLGMIGATAQGVRLSQSKLRYYTQDFSRSLFSVVRGKEVWRVVGAKEMEEGKRAEIGNKKLYARILSLLKRLLPGEEKNEKLFEIMDNFYIYLVENNLEKEKMELVEYATVVRILTCLGYVSHDHIPGSHIDEEILEKVTNSKGIIIKEINNGLKESQL